MKPEDSVYFGVDPFAAQRAKIEAEKKQKQREEEAAKLLAKKNEHLDLNNPDIEGVQKEIAEMEEENKKRRKRNAKIDKGLDTLDAMMPIEGEENMRFPKYAEPEEENEEAQEAPQSAQPEKSAEEPKSDKPKTQRKQKIRITKEESSVDPWKMDVSSAALYENLSPGDTSKAQVGGINLRGDMGLAPWGEGKISTANLAEKRKKAEENKPAEENAEQKPKKPRKPRTPKPQPEETAQPETPVNAEEKPVEQPVEQPTEPVEEKPKAKRGRPRKQPVVEEPTTSFEPAEEEVKEEPAKADEQLAAVEEKPGRKPRKPKAQTEGQEISPTTRNQKYSKPSGKAKNIDVVDEKKVQVGGISGLDDPWSFNLGSGQKPKKDNGDGNN
ncbi:MAG: hypothetical protein J5713_02730 [Clostridia bacterium]|nr:hypothetical protein [Clostridia bacterium]